MPVIRTQIYLTPELRDKVEEAMRREGKSMAQIIREALTDYLSDRHVDREIALDNTFGRVPGLQIRSPS